MRIYVTKTVGRNTVEGTFRDMPRSTVNRISEEVGSSRWYKEAIPEPRKRRLQAEMKGEKP